jgi:hypothetical protein
MSPELQAVFRRFGNQAGVAKAFGVTPPAVIKWVRAGTLPLLRRYQWRDMQKTPRKTAGGPFTAAPASGEG